MYKNMHRDWSRHQYRGCDSTYYSSTLSFSKNIEYYLHVWNSYAFYSMIKSMFQLTHKKLNGATQFQFDWISVS